MDDHIASIYEGDDPTIIDNIKVLAYWFRPGFYGDIEILTALDQVRPIHC